MTNRRPPRTLGAVVLAGSVATLLACSGPAPASPSPEPSPVPSPTACAAAVSTIVDATQKYVDGFGDASAAAADPASPSPTTGAGGSDPTTPAAGGDVEFQAALTAARRRLSDQGCDSTEVRSQLTEGLGAVRTEGPVAAAVLRQLTASMTRDTTTSETTRAVAPGDDLLEAVAELPPGSTLSLAEGVYRLDEALVLLSSITVVGAGADRTTIESTATDSAILAVADGRIDLDRLTVTHTGPEPANVVLAGSAAAIAATGARFTGGVAREDGTGGAGILMYAPDAEATAATTTLEVTDSVLADNASAGIVLTGGNVASVVGSTFSDNGQCGICFLDLSGGSVEEGTFTDNAVGMAATGQAAPAIVDATIRGGTVGVQASDDAAPVLRNVTIRGASRAGLIYSGKAAGTLDGVSCTDVPFGLVIGPSVTTRVVDVDCRVAASP